MKSDNELIIEALFIVLGIIMSSVTATLIIFCA